MSPFALDGVPLLLRARLAAKHMLENPGVKHVKALCGLLISFAKASAFGKKWVAVMTPIFATPPQVRGDRGYLTS